jgi:hypothetical protein
VSREELADPIAELEKAMRAEQEKAVPDPAPDADAGEDQGGADDAGGPSKS